MQIVPNPNVSWANPAAASQQASSQQRGPTNAANADTGPRGGIDGVERSSETSDRDANGQYAGSGSEQQPNSEDEQIPTPGPSLLELPAENDGTEPTLDLLG